MIRSGKLGFMLIALGLTGCASLPPKQRISQTIAISPTSRCGYLLTFVDDANQLSKTEQHNLLTQLAPGAEQSPSSCDALKTGLVLSQTAETISQDDRAITILQSFIDENFLTSRERNLVVLLHRQVKQRRQLHVQVSEIERQLASEQLSTEKMSSRLLELQGKLEQLLQIEDEINQSEQFFTSPSSSDIPN